MRSDVARDLTDSSYDFERVVWPAIAPLLGGGRLVRQESPEAAGDDALLDASGGIDFWQKTDRGLVRGIASRVQWLQKPWDTFTIRTHRMSGAMTELQKRREAIKRRDEGYLYPSVTIQAYITERRVGRLLSAAAIATVDLYEYVAQGTGGVSGDWSADWWSNATSNASFIAVPWSKLMRADRHVHVVRPSVAKIPAPEVRRPEVVKQLSLFSLYSLIVFGIHWHEIREPVLRWLGIG